MHSWDWVDATLIGLQAPPTIQKAHAQKVGVRTSSKSSFVLAFILHAGPVTWKEFRNSFVQNNMPAHWESVSRKLRPGASGPFAPDHLKEAMVEEGFGGSSVFRLQTAKPQPCSL